MYIVLKIQIHNVRIYVYVHVHICTYIRSFIYRSTNEEKHLRPGHYWFYQFGNAGNGTSCENQFMLPRGKWNDCKGTHFYDAERALLISGGWTVCVRMRWISHLRSGMQQTRRMLTPRRCLWPWLSTQANWELLVSRSRKCCPRSLRPRRAAGARAAWGYASVRVWVPHVSCHQWMLTLSPPDQGDGSKKKQKGQKKMFAFLGS